MQGKVMLFSNKGCGPCTVAEAQLKRAKIEYVKIMHNEENAPLFEKYGAQSAPTIVATGGSGEVLYSNSGLPVDAAAILAAMENGAKEETCSQ